MARPDHPVSGAEPDAARERGDGRRASRQERPTPTLPALLRAQPGPGGTVRLRLGPVSVGRVDALEWEQMGLRSGELLDAQGWAVVEAALANRCAYERGLRLLALRDRSRRDLQRRLSMVCGPVAAAAALGRLAPHLDDERFARAWIAARQRTRPVGRAVLLAGLARQGVEGEIARRVVEEAMGQAAPEDGAGPDAGSLSPRTGEAAACCRAAQVWVRRLNSAVPIEARDRARLYGYLARRGFAWPLARDAVREVLGERALGESPGLDGE